MGKIDGKEVLKKGAITLLITSGITCGGITAKHIIDINSNKSKLSDINLKKEDIIKNISKSPTFAEWFYTQQNNKYQSYLEGKASSEEYFDTINYLSSEEAVEDFAKEHDENLDELNSLEKTSDKLKKENEDKSKLVVVGTVSSLLSLIAGIGLSQDERLYKEALRKMSAEYADESQEDKNDENEREM